MLGCKTGSAHSKAPFLFSLGACLGRPWGLCSGGFCSCRELRASRGPAAGAQGQNLSPAKGLQHSTAGLAGEDRWKGRARECSYQERTTGNLGWQRDGTQSRSSADSRRLGHCCITHHLLSCSRRGSTHPAQRDQNGSSETVSWALLGSPRCTPWPRPLAGQPSLPWTHPGPALPASAPDAPAFSCPAASPSSSSSSRAEQICMNGHKPPLLSRPSRMGRPRVTCSDRPIRLLAKGLGAWPLLLPALHFPPIPVRAWGLSVHPLYLPGTMVLCNGPAAGTHSAGVSRSHQASGGEHGPFLPRYPEGSRGPGFGMSSLQSSSIQTLGKMASWTGFSRDDQDRAKGWTHSDFLK